jgi:hypothetical protein
MCLQIKRLLKETKACNEKEVALNHHHLPMNICNKINAWKVKLANKAL